MKDYKAILDSVHFPNGLTRRQTFRVLIWSLFNGKRLKRLIDGIESGRHLKASYDYARSNETIKQKSKKEPECICEMQPGVTGFCHKHKTDWM